MRWRGGGRNCRGFGSYKNYTFDTDKGKQSLRELFAGRSQLIVYHFMFGPDCRRVALSCSMIADAFTGSVVHLANHDVMFWAISRAPLAKLQAYHQRMGWTFPVASLACGRLQLRLQRLVHPGATARRRYRVQRSARRPRDGRDAGPGARRPVRGNMRNGCSRLLARQAGHERVRARGRCRARSHLFHLRPRRGPILWRGLLLHRAPKGPHETGPWWRRHDEYDKR